MILTPTNRYDMVQGLMLRAWPLLSPLLIGGLRKFGGVRGDLGRAIALSTRSPGAGVETLHWDGIMARARLATDASPP